MNRKDRRYYQKRHQQWLRNRPQHRPLNWYKFCVLELSITLIFLFSWR
jgi:hypothetical protein